MQPPNWVGDNSCGVGRSCLALSTAVPAGAPTRPPAPRAPSVCPPATAPALRAGRPVCAGIGLSPDPPPAAGAHLPACRGCRALQVCMRARSRTHSCTQTRTFTLDETDARSYTLTRVHSTPDDAHSYSHTLHHAHVQSHIRLLNALDTLLHARSPDAMHRCTLKPTSKRVPSHTHTQAARHRRPGRPGGASVDRAEAGL